MPASHSPDGIKLPQPLEARFAVVRRLSLLEGVSDNKLADLVTSTRWQDHSADEVILDVGDTKKDVFIVTEGVVRVIVRTAFGYESILDDLGTGSFFGELAAIDGMQRSANVTALSRTRLCVIPGSTFMELVLASPQVAHRLLCVLSAQVRNKDERLIEFGSLTVRQRLIAEMLRLSRSRGEKERVISPPPTQHVLAARVGTRRETISREMAEMSRSKLLTIQRGGIVLHRPEKLRAEIEARLQG